MPRSRRIERMAAVLAKRLPDLTVVLENIHDPHNVSAILRTCDAVGVVRVELLYTCESFPKIGRKSSSSASKWVERRKHTSVEECYAVLRSEGYRIIATRLDANAQTLYESTLTGKVALVLGNEHRGVSEAAASQADSRLYIPMRGMIESLNVSVAAAVLLYEALRQRLARGPVSVPALPPEQYDAMLADWIKR